MCGIIGYTGDNYAQNILLEGLSQLEYRGYDSAGIALLTDDNQIIINKEIGKVASLASLCGQEKNSSTCGIGHTRWATHGGVTKTNAHPHSCGKVSLIHNGIIENYYNLIQKYDLKEKLISETDTEVVAALLDTIYTGDPEKAIKQVVGEIKGSFAFCIMFADIPGVIYCIRNVSPLVATSCESGSYIASDLTALIPYSKDYFIVPEYHVVILEKEHITVKDLDGNHVKPEILTVSWDIESAQKNGYPYFMLKEIMEQPTAIKNTIAPRIKDLLPDFTDDFIPDSLFVNLNKIAIIACGTAMHAGMVAKTMIEPLLRIPVTVSIASEFRYEEPLVDENTLVITISQSGETIDTLEALRLAKRYKGRTISIVNVKGSSIARESDYVLYTHAGPEIAVASTKAYTVQLAALYLLGCKAALINDKYSKEQAKEFITNLTKVIDDITLLLKDTTHIKEIAEKITKASDAFFIGRGLDYTLSLEGALKLKEISYIHAEAYAAGELKHGTIALISDDVPVIALATQEKVYGKVISNIREVKARNAYVILLSCDDEISDSSICDVHIPLSKADDLFTVFQSAVILQLIAYYTSDAKGLDVDKPRNLAKSVTVE
ncbi:glutamine--fructose-6-phosphate transaminase (isomerizing) [Candidatus Galacturonibacter soehngenii]|uniref:Glutamine--fructose-6-phosphate aminotransferase [isomerizing] n=1 Tax=Candidatus Galacturonatibacter soehngenii TaxID=2307010 RepID=A0A7V7QKY1_9FIRM|nr:glutamine--fructose-6-phosphate transaminase (isomerizing) [Candidatus Galacturonibacter soehngenii]KAB1438535.1 glutamine--fructose-6-phosphate transaminase (isomerizing) [Candidatus Galacturonibacter soehngenii]